MGILKPISNLLGYIMEGIFRVLSMIGIENVGLSIIIFTIIVYTLMLPMTIKQQKFTRISSVMNPEIQAIQKKYQGKNDQASMMKMQEETKLVYAKYGTSPTGGCLGMLIQFPILFALWPVVREIEKYVDIEITDKMNKFLWINDISRDPWSMLKEAWNDFSILLIIGAIAIPVLSGLTQWLSMKLSQKSTNTGNNDNQAMNQMNAMMNFMPLLSVFMCFTMPAGLGLYWVASAVVRTVQQIGINKYIDKQSLEQIIEKNKEKVEKKQEKYKQVSASVVNQKAQQRTKKVTSSYSGDTYRQGAKPGSLASKANMVSDFNRNNNK